MKKSSFSSSAAENLVTSCRNLMNRKLFLIQFDVKAKSEWEAFKAIKRECEKGVTSLPSFPLLSHFFLQYNNLAICFHDATVFTVNTQQWKKWVSEKGK